MNKSSRLPLRACRWLLLLLFGFAAALRADELPIPLPTLAQQVQDFANETSHAVAAAGRVEIIVGELDARLRLAPCSRAEPYLPNGTRLWGKAHIGVRCVQGPKAWNVYLPITVKVYGRGLVAASALPAGATLRPADMVEAEIDLAAEPGTVFPLAQAPALAGRTLLRAVSAGQGLRSTALKVRQWFAAGDVVRITALGSGFAVEASGEALNAGIEGQTARVRTDSGRIISATPVGEREVELAL